jgi:phosphoribosyl-dephospho-CoA transferase
MAPLASDPRWRAHDLLKIRRLPARVGEPSWVREAVRLAPFVVVRRAPASCGRVAVGVRGATRAQRYGTWIEVADVEATLAPEDLAGAAARDPRRTLPAFALLAALRDAPILDGRVWGPCGSAGFELATGVATVTASSDLDLLVRAPDPVGREAALALLRALSLAAQRAGVRVDVQLETPAGGLALAELVSDRPRVMARHAQGPRLVVDPWTMTAAAGSGV